jgi:hypothetical protein
LNVKRFLWKLMCAQVATFTTMYFHHSLPMAIS